MKTIEEMAHESGGYLDSSDYYVFTKSALTRFVALACDDPLRTELARGRVAEALRKNEKERA